MDDDDETYDPGEEWDNPEDWPWGDIDAIHVTRDDSGWDVSVEIDGELIDVISGLDDETAQDYIWDELYSLADEYGVYFDKEVEYAKD